MRVLGLGERARAVLPDDAVAWFDALDRRLTALERWVSMQPDLEDLDQEIAQVRRDKEAADAPAGFPGRHGAARQGEAVARRPG